MKEIYIEIASCIVKIEFLPLKKDELYHDNKRQRRIFTKNIVTFLSKFILTNTPEKVDFIIFIEGHHIVFIHNNKLQIVSIPLFKKLSETSVRSYDYLNIFQFQLLLRDIVAKLLIQRNGCVVHASALARNGNAYLFLGQSGAGKSTIVRLLKETFLPLADDVVFIRKEKGKYFLYQTPFIEKQWWIKKESKKLPITHIFLIQKDKETFLEKNVHTTNILPLWLNQNLVAYENKEEIVKWSITFMKSNIKFYNLHFQKRKDKLQQTLYKQI